MEFEGWMINRPFPSSLVPLFENESKCETFHMKMSSACSFIFMLIKGIFRKSGFTLRLVLKQRHKGTRKWPTAIRRCAYSPGIQQYQSTFLIWLRYHAHLAKFGFGKWLIVPVWYYTLWWHIRFVWSHHEYFSKTTSRQKTIHGLTKLARYRAYALTRLQPCKFIWTRKCLHTKRVKLQQDSDRIGLVRQHGCCFIVLNHQ